MSTEDSPYFHPIEAQIWKLGHDFGSFSEDLTRHFNSCSCTKVEQKTNGNCSISGFCDDGQPPEEEVFDGTSPDAERMFNSSLQANSGDLVIGLTGSAFLEQLEDLNTQLRQLFTSVREQLTTTPQASPSLSVDHSDKRDKRKAIRNGEYMLDEMCSSLNRVNQLLHANGDDTSDSDNDSPDDSFNRRDPCPIPEDEQTDKSESHYKSSEDLRNSTIYDSLLFVRRSSSVGNLTLPGRLSSHAEDHYIDFLGDDGPDPPPRHPNVWVPRYPSRGRRPSSKKRPDWSQTVPRSAGSLIRRPVEPDPLPLARPKGSGEFKKVAVSDIMEPEIQGVLTKKVPGSSAWKRSLHKTDKRWFVLKEGYLFYYESQTSSSPKNVIRVRDFMIHLEKDWILLKPKQGCGRVFELKAKSGEDRDRWFSQLLRAAKNKGAAISREQTDAPSPAYNDPVHKSRDALPELPAESAEYGTAWSRPPLVPPRPPETLEEEELPVYDAVGGYSYT